ncbi:MAG: DUF5817 domain-containing protein [Halodesulfurarchaeum sp.]
MYAVVGCGECGALWIVEGKPETTRCPRCDSRHQFDRLKKFVRTEDREEARQVRAAILAAEQGESAAFEALDPPSDLEAAAAEAGIEDESFLEAKGIDPAAVERAGERATAGRERLSTKEVIRSSLERLDRPTEAAIIEYCTDRGVEEEAVRAGLEKLRREGEITRRDGQYRLL